MSKSVRMFAALMLVWGLHTPALAQSETFDFTGTVQIGATGFGLTFPADAVVTGTVTYDYGVADPAEAQASPGNTTYFFAGSNLGPSKAPPDPGALVFSMTASVDGYSYQSVPAVAGEYRYGSGVTGSTFFYGGGELQAIEQQQATLGGPFTASSFYLTSATGVPYDSSGFPIPFSITEPQNADVGSFYISSGGVTNYIPFLLTSLSPATVVTAVPEPSTYVSMVMGLLMLFAAMQRKRADRPGRGARTF